MTRLTSDSRRRFLKRSGFLALGFTVPLLDVHSQQAASADKPRLPGDLQVNRTLSAWIRIQSEEQSVLLMVGKVELGQGILTAVVQVCADELDVEMARVKVVSGDTALVPNEGTTAGSFSMAAFSSGFFVLADSNSIFSSFGIIFAMRSPSP